MKRVLSLICAVWMLVALAACGNPDEGYNEAYEDALKEIAALNEATDDIADYNLAAWDKVGADNVIYFLDMSATAQSIADVGEGLAWKTDYPLMDKVFDTNVQHANGMANQQKEITDKVIPHFVSYQEALKTAEDKDAAIKNLIKDLKERYGEKHAEAIDALSQYYLDSSSYYEYVMELTGKNLMTYQSEIGTFQTTIVSSRKAAELAE